MQNLAKVGRTWSRRAVSPISHVSRTLRPATGPSAINTDKPARPDRRRTYSAIPFLFPPGRRFSKAQVTRFNQIEALFCLHGSIWLIHPN